MSWPAKAGCASATVLNVKGLANGRLIMSCPDVPQQHYHSCDSSALLKAGLFAKGRSVSRHHDVQC